MLPRKDRYHYRSWRDDEGRVRRDYLGKTSDPAVSLLARTYRLDTIIQHQQLKRCRREHEELCRDEGVFVRLSASSRYWPLLDAAYEQMTPEHRRLLFAACDCLDEGYLLIESPEMAPTEREFRSLCQAADAGDPAAAAQLAAVLDQVPDVVAGMTDLLAAARRIVVDFIADGSQVVAEATNRTIDSHMRLLVDETCDDPLGKMYAEIVAVAWLDAMRCAVGSARGSSSQRASTFWSGAASRSATRFARIASGYRKHVDRWCNNEKSPSSAVPAAAADAADNVTQQPIDDLQN